MPLRGLAAAAAFSPASSAASLAVAAASLAASIAILAAASADALDHAVDYERVGAEVTTLFQQGQFALLEAMAEAAAARLLEQMPEVQAVRIEIRKPRAVPAAQYSFVRVERTRT